MNTEKTLDQVMEKAERDFYDQDPCIEPPSYIVTQEPKSKGILVLSEQFIAEWNDAYSSFKAVLDTPIGRRKFDDAFSQSARTHMRNLDEALKASILLAK
jgi:hypothetical protein